MNAAVFQTQLVGDVLVVVPTIDLRELEFDQLEDGAQDLMDLIRSGRAKHVVVDFERTDYYGSTALSFFLKVWKRVKSAGGRMVLCNVSRHEQEILELTHLDSLWPVCGSRKEALAAVERLAATS